MTIQYLKIAIGTVLALALGACQTTQEHELEVKVEPKVMSAYLVDKPANLHRLYAPVLTQGPRNIVLNHMRVGLAALEMKKFDLAAESFDQSLSRIETVYANNEKAEKARELWFKENIKDFKGEPYERAMAYYYRGLNYMVSGDYENARASFKGGMLQDAFAEDKQDRSDYAMLAYLEGWSSKCLGNSDLAKESFDEAEKIRPTLVRPEENDDHLIIVETGNAPQKVAGGDFKEKLTFLRGKNSDESMLQLRYNGDTSELAPAEDLFIQASTRGGRPVDHILAGKVTFKENADATGDVLLTAGAATMGMGGSDEAVIAGAVMMLVGVIAKASAEAAQAEADVRVWDNLPDKIFLASAEYQSDSSDPSAYVLDSGGNVVADSEVALPVIDSGNKCKLSWARNKSALAIGDKAPGSFVPSE